MKRHQEFLGVMEVFCAFIFVDSAQADVFLKTHQTAHLQ